MKYFACFALLCFANTFAYEVVSDGEQEYLLVPLDHGHRVRRQTSVTYDTGSRVAGIAHTGTLVNNNKHSLQGTAFAQRQFHPKGPLTTGGQLDYMHKPSASSLNIGAQNTRGFGTDFSAAGRYNFVNKPNTQVFAQGQYNRHFGGPFGTGRPNYGVGLGVQHRF